MKKITKLKTKYYSKEILKYILLTGAVFVVASSPYFVLRLTQNIFRSKPVKKQKFSDAFYYLKKKGLIEIEREGYDFKIALTQEGKRRAGKYQIDDLEIRRPKKWDGKWRLVIFDIPHQQRIKRNVFRNKLKGMGFYPFQKSVWLHAFDCKEEVKLLREFLGLNKRDIEVLLVEKIDGHDSLKRYFKL